MRIDQLQLDNRSRNSRQAVLIPPGIPMVSNDRPRHEGETSRDHFYSIGFQLQNGFVFNPLDVWGVGYAQTTLENDDHEKLVEGYYNFLISEKLRLSFHLQHVFEAPTGAPSVGFLVPAIRLQARF